MNECFNCRYWYVYDHKWPCDVCVDHDKWERRVLLNYDLIVHKSPEELAKWLDERVSDCPWCNPDSPVVPGSNECECFDCSMCCQEWLMKEAEDDGI